MGNPYFDHLRGISNSKSWNIYNNAADEIVNKFGVDFAFIPRSGNKPDFIFGEDTLTNYQSYKKITMKIESYDFYEGEGDIFQSFGFEITDRMTLSVGINSLISMFAENEFPVEEDLLYHYASEKIFEIVKIEKEKSFHQLGKSNMYWEIIIKPFEYSMEDVETDDENIDSINEIFDVNDDREKDQFENEQTETIDLSNPEKLFG